MVFIPLELTQGNDEMKMQLVKSLILLTKQGRTLVYLFYIMVDSFSNTFLSCSSQFPELIFNHLHLLS